MTVFITLMVVGLVGLVMMAIPGMNRHGHAGAGGHGIAHGGLRLGSGTHAAGHAPVHAGHAPAGAHAHTAVRAPGQAKTPETDAGLARFIPSPRSIFSLLTAYGAAGYAFVGAAHLTPLLAGLLAVVPAFLLERYAFTPMWNAMLQFQGEPCSPLEYLVLQEAEAVTPFHNGKGVVQVERDGRLVQFSAHLPQTQATIPVRVGDKLRIEEVDAQNERVIVSLH